MHKPEVVLINYGAGNLMSIKNALEYCGANVVVTSDKQIILEAKRIILPGVGAFNFAMRSLKDLDLIDSIIQVANNNVPFLGICLGMQLLFDESDEFEKTKGLGLISGHITSIKNLIPSDLIQKIPHIGWTELHKPDSLKNWEDTLLSDYLPHESAYFLHSYVAVPSISKNKIADFFYGSYNLTAMVRKDNINGCQFHPEKSGEVGLNILRRFLLQ